MAQIATKTETKGKVEKSTELTREQIKEKMMQADYVRLADIVGCTREYTWRVIKGTRNSEFILSIARKYLAQREELKRECDRLKNLQLLPEKI